MAAARTTKRDLLGQQLQNIEVIDEETWMRLKRELSPISDSYLHSLLKHSGRPLAPLVEGVNTSTLSDAERTLKLLAAEYERAEITGRKTCRALVISAKQRLRWSVQRAAKENSMRPEKEEILLWISTWLENPTLFPDWVLLRRQRCPTEARTTRP
jgi:hypothetical protein